MNEFRFKLKGKTIVLIDWANVYGWFKKFEKKDFKKIYPGRHSLTRGVIIMLYHKTTNNQTTHPSIKIKK